MRNKEKEIIYPEGRDMLSSLEDSLDVRNGQPAMRAWKSVMRKAIGSCVGGQERLLHVPI